MNTVIVNDIRLKLEKSKITSISSFDFIKNSFIRKLDLHKGRVYVSISLNKNEELESILLSKKDNVLIFKFQYISNSVKKLIEDYLNSDVDFVFVNRKKVVDVLNQNYIYIEKKR